jgi:hypothetical protein
MVTGKINLRTGMVTDYLKKNEVVFIQGLILVSELLNALLHATSLSYIHLNSRTVI